MTSADPQFPMVSASWRLVRGERRGKTNNEGKKGGSESTNPRESTQEKRLRRENKKNDRKIEDSRPLKASVSEGETKEPLLLSPSHRRRWHTGASCRPSGPVHSPPRSLCGPNKQSRTVSVVQMKRKAASSRAACWPQTFPGGNKGSDGVDQRETIETRLQDQAQIGDCFAHFGFCIAECSYCFARRAESSQERA